MKASLWRRPLHFGQVASLQQLGESLLWDSRCSQRLAQFLLDGQVPPLVRRPSEARNYKVFLFDSLCLDPPSPPKYPLMYPKYPLCPSQEDTAGSRAVESPYHSTDGLSARPRRGCHIIQISGEGGHIPRPKYRPKTLNLHQKGPSR